MTEFPVVTKKAREQATQILFDLGVNSLFLSSRAVLAVYSTGRVTGVSIDCDDDTVSIGPVYEGQAMKNATKRLIVDHADTDGSTESAIAETVSECISDCDLDIRGELYENIVLAGDPTDVDLEELWPRIENAVRHLGPPNQEVKMTVPNDPQNGPWRDGSLLGEQRSFKRSLVTRSELEDKGPRIVHKKCL